VPVVSTGGAELVVGPDQRERGSGGEELGVRSGGEEFVRVLRIQDFARRLVGRFVGRFARRKRNNFDSPEATGEIGSAEDSGNAILQGFDGCGQQWRAQQENDGNETRN